MRRRRSVDGRTGGRGPARLGAPWLVLVAVALAACGGSLPASGSDVPTGSPPAGPSLGAASEGLCAALAALPDAASAERAFVNQAHDALHALAAAPSLDRSASARVLEAMDRVEQDFDAAAGGAGLGADLEALHSAADDALGALGIQVTPCGP